MSSEFDRPENSTPRSSGGLDADLQREVDDALGDLSLDEILQAEEATPARPSTAGGVRQGRVIAVQGDDVFVYFGGKTQGILPASQFEDEPLPREGDVIEVTIEGYDNNDDLLLLSRKGAVLEATWDSLQRGSIVEGRVTGLNKGGLELTINGLRAFMPISQVDVGRVEDLTPFLNERMKCEVTEVNRAEQNIVVSRRRVLEAEAEEAKKETLQTLEVGDVVRGRVKTIMPYGAFVDIGGVDGLLHISDMSHAHVDDPRSVVKEGDAIDVKVLKFNSETGKISLGLKQTLADPWSDADQKWQPGQAVTGRVTRLADFGAFVELEPGVEGLIPMGEMAYGRRIRSAEEVVKVNDVVQVRVISVDSKRKRISLSLKQMQDDPWMGASQRWPEQSVVEGRVSRITEFGAFVEVSSGVEGLVHISQLSTQHVRNVREAVREGDLVKAAVLSVDEDARRMSLSIKALSEGGSAAAPATLDLPKPKARKKPLKGGLE